MLTNQMKAYGETISDLMKIENMPRTFTARVDHIVVAIEKSKDFS